MPLARHLIGRLGATTGRHRLSLSKQTEERLTRYTWPGNIRELENVIQRAMILAPGNVDEHAGLSFSSTVLAAFSADEGSAQHVKGPYGGSNAAFDGCAITEFWTAHQ